MLFFFFFICLNFGMFVIAQDDCGGAVRWVKGKEGVVPSGAVYAGENIPGASKSKVYVGRVRVENIILPGKYVPAVGQTVVWHDSDPYGLSDFEVLVDPANQAMWANTTTTTIKNIPRGAVLAGVEENMEELYVCRASHEGVKIPGKLVESTKNCHFEAYGDEYVVTNFEILLVY